MIFTRSYTSTSLITILNEKTLVVISKKRENNLLIVELKADNTIFMLGYRAKRLVENCILAKNNNDAPEGAI